MERQGVLARSQPSSIYAAWIAAIGYLAGGLCVACLLALFVLGGRGVRVAVVAFVVLALTAYGLFLLWLVLYGE